MAGIQVSLQGLESVIRNIDNAYEKIDKAIKGAMVKTALIDIETEAKMKLTSDGHIDTGRLRASLHTAYKSFHGERGKNKHNYSDDEGNSYTDVLNVSGHMFNVIVGTTVEYAEAIEEIDSFLFFAFNKGKLKLKDRVQAEIRRALR